MTLGAVAREISRETGCEIEVWQVRKCFEKHVLPEPSRIGIARIIAAADLPVIRQALEKLGYLPKAEQ